MKFSVIAIVMNVITFLGASTPNAAADTIGDDNGDAQVQPVLVGYDGCDESKCVSSGLWFLFNYSFTCYIDVDGPMMCADGYQAQLVEKETTSSDNYHYFTCCPPTNNSSSYVRHCSNTTTLRDLNNTMICEDNTRPYPRQMKTQALLNDDGVHSYVCCDSIIDTNDNHTINFLTDIECVPYSNNKYQVTQFFGNIYGIIEPFTCDDPEVGFRYRNKQGDCCQTKQKSYHFYQDTPFMTTVYPQVILSSLAMISCTILMVAMLIPLGVHLKLQAAVTNVSSGTNRATYRRLKQAATASTYSSYNLYLVFLALPDFILNLYLLTMYGSYANQKYNPNFSGLIIYENYNAFESAFILSCSTANLYLNCVIAYEVLVLLQNSNQFMTHNPPSLSRVTLQAMAVYLLSITVFIMYYFIGKKVIEEEQRYNETYSDTDIRNNYKRLALSNLVWSLLVTYAFPIGIFFSVWVIIIYRGYMPSVTAKTKQLVWFFFRIVIVFCVIWLPGMGFVTVGCYYGVVSNEGMLVQVGLLFCGIQPIISTCMAMTKADVREYTVKTISLSYIRTTQPSEGEGETRTETRNI